MVLLTNKRNGILFENPCCDRPFSENKNNDDYASKVTHIQRQNIYIGQKWMVFILLTPLQTDSSL